MTRKKIDLTGRRFGRLTVIKEAIPTQNYKGYNLRRWLCKCDCGNETKVITGALTGGNTFSCGCIRRERGAKMLSSANPRYKEDTDLKQLKKKKQKNNTSGVTGVVWHKQLQKWEARIKLKGKRHHLGTFDDKQDAINARKEAEEKYFKPILEKYDDTEKK